MNVRVDTSVWVGHFKLYNEHLAALLEPARAVCHPYVVVELACGTPANRRSILDSMVLVERVAVATTAEVLAMIEQRRCFGRGCGSVDLSLLASALPHGSTQIWTLDQRLQAGAAEAVLNYRPQVQSWGSGRLRLQAA